MNMKTPSHLLSNQQVPIPCPISETSTDAVHHDPTEQHRQDSGLNSSAQYEQQQQQYQSQYPQHSSNQYDQQQQQQQQQQPRSPSYDPPAAAAPTVHDRHDGQSASAHQRPAVTQPSSNNPTSSHGVSPTVCSNCGTTTTPLWRRAPNGETICNACGLYLKARNTVRPPWLKRNAIKKPTAQPAHEARDGSCAADGHCNGTGGSARCDGCPAYNQHQVNRQSLICANCHTTTTPLWRRDETGNTICNACGLYYKLHNVHRPVTMKRSVIKRRKRVALVTNSPQPSHHHHHAHHHHHHHHIAPSPSTSGNEDGDDGLDHMSINSQSENGSSTEDEGTDQISRKRKNIGSFDNVARPQPKRPATQVPQIEDLHAAKRHQDSWYPSHSPSTPSSPASSTVGDRRSPTPVEPAPFQHSSQVQIHGHHHHVPTAPAAYQNGALSPPYQRSHSPPVTSPSSISSLLNPAVPTSSSAAPTSATTAPTTTLPSISLLTTPPTPSTPGYQFPPITSGLATEQAQQILQSHRQELQREVSNLSMLLTRTAAMLSNLDQAMAASGTPPAPTSAPTTAGVPPLASLLNTDPTAAATAIMALASAAQQAANVQAAATAAANAAAAASTVLPPPMLPPPQNYHQLPPVGRSYWQPYSSSRSEADSPPQRMPTPPFK